MRKNEVLFRIQTFTLEGELLKAFDINSQRPRVNDLIFHGNLRENLLNFSILIW